MNHKLEFPLFETFKNQIFLMSIKNTQTTLQNHTIFFLIFLPRRREEKFIPSKLF